MDLSIVEINDTFGLYIEWIIRLTPPKRWEREIYEITSKSDRQFKEGRDGRVFPFYKFNENYDFIKEQEGREIVPIAESFPYKENCGYIYKST